jgi:hypothetical protein
MTALGVTTKILKDNNFGQLGFYSMSLMFLFFGFFSFFMGPIVRKLGDKYAFSLGTFCLSFYIGGFFLPMMRAEYKDNETLQGMYGFIYGFILFCAIMGGLGNALLWCTQGAYLSKCSDTTNAGIFNGLFWTMFMSSQILGNCLGAFVIANVG